MHRKKIVSRIIMIVVAAWFISFLTFGRVQIGILDVVGSLFFLSGIIFYIFMTLKYSGKDKRHFHERETEVSIRDFEYIDRHKVRVTRGTKSTIGEIKYSNQADLGKWSAKIAKLKGKKT